MFQGSLGPFMKLQSCLIQWLPLKYTLWSWWCINQFADNEMDNALSMPIIHFVDRKHKFLSLSIFLSSIYLWRYQLEAHGPPRDAWGPRGVQEDPGHASPGRAWRRDRRHPCRQGLQVRARVVRQLQEGNCLPLPGQDGVLSLFQHGEHFITQSCFTLKLDLAVPKNLHDWYNLHSDYDQVW